MKIPKKVTLAGIDINVVIDTHNEELRGNSGAACYRSQQIILDGTSYKEQSVEQAYFHELVHWILFIMNEDELKENEQFVDVFAHLLYQATKSGEESIKK